MACTVHVWISCVWSAAALRSRLFNTTSLPTSPADYQDPPTLTYPPIIRTPLPSPILRLLGPPYPHISFNRSSHAPTVMSSAAIFIRTPLPSPIPQSQFICADGDELSGDVGGGMIASTCGEDDLVRYRRISRRISRRMSLGECLLASCFRHALGTISRHDLLASYLGAISRRISRRNCRRPCSATIGPTSASCSANISANISA